jgi:hypothetical protein
VSAEELEEYKRIIAKREKGDESPASPRDDTIADTMGDTTDPGAVLSAHFPFSPCFHMYCTYRLTGLPIPLTVFGRFSASTHTEE